MVAPVPPERSAGPTPGDTGLDLVTGAFGNTGSAIAARLHAKGRRLRTLTSHPAPGRPVGPTHMAGPRASADDNPFRAGTGAAESPAEPDAIDVLPYTFDDADQLAAAFEGVTTFYNTYWTRTARGPGGYGATVARSRALITAAEGAGVQRIVHLSVAHPSLDSPYPYFRAKAQVEAALSASSVPAAVVRPTVIFGGDAVLLHNLAWMLRRLPVFAVAGDGRYRIRPVHVDDLARICVDAGARGADGTADPNEVIDAVGPERPEFLDLVTELRDAIGSRARIVRLPAGLVLPSARVLGLALGDDVLTRDELISTMDGLADSDGPATGTVRLSEWLTDHATELGRSYINERGRRRAPSP